MIAWVCTRKLVVTNIINDIIPLRYLLKQTAPYLRLKVNSCGQVQNYSNFSLQEAHFVKPEDRRVTGKLSVTSNAIKNICANNGENGKTIMYLFSKIGGVYSKEIFLTIGGRFYEYVYFQLWLHNKRSPEGLHMNRTIRKNVKY